MSMNKSERAAILRRLIIAIGENSVSFSPIAFAKSENLSSQSVYRYLQMLSADGKINIQKNGSRNVYTLTEETCRLEYPLADLVEDIVWRNDVAPFFKELPETAFANLAYAFTEMLNNAIDHSGGDTVQVLISKNGYRARVIMCDNGVGIFSKIAEAMGFTEKSFSILELAKGKFTTDPRSHTGEGVFFSSKVMDEFAIISDGLIFLGPNSDSEAFLDRTEDSFTGTFVTMEIRYEHYESKSAVFDRFTQAPDDYGFSKTIVPVRLLEYGDDRPLVVSRSQAKRLMVRFERFQNIILDFSGIEEIGQGFADELFRVFQSQHPNTRLSPVNCNDAVLKMIKRVTAGQ